MVPWLGIYQMCIGKKKQENKNLTLEDYVDVYMKANNIHYENGSTEYETLKDNIKETYSKDLNFVGCNFDKIVNDFHKEITKLSSGIIRMIRDRNDTDNTILLLVPHSQGNLYANSLRNYLVSAEKIPAKNIGIYGIANPADRISSTAYLLPSYLVGDVEDNYAQYITADNDYVINSLRRFSSFSPVTNAPLNANIHLKTCNDSDICHGLTNAYLADENASLTISKKINLFILSLEGGLIDKTDSPQIVYRNFVEPVSLVNDSTGRILCSDGNCDNDIFGYIYLDSNYFVKELGDYKDFRFSFPGKLEAGAYSIIINTLKNHLSPIPIWSNALESAYSYYISSGCFFSSDSKYCFSEKRSTIQWSNEAYFQFLGIDVSDFIKDYFGLEAPEITFCGKLPEICYNNKFILGRFVLALKRLKRSAEVASFDQLQVLMHKMDKFHVIYRPNSDVKV